MLQETRPAEPDTQGDSDRRAQFRIDHLKERLALLRNLRDGTVPILLNGPDGVSCTTALWAIDEVQCRLVFTVDDGAAARALTRLIEQNEAMAVAYLASVKLQFDLQGLMLVRGPQANTLQCRLPAEIYRFQRRNAYRVRTAGRRDPVARLCHPTESGRSLALRVLDLSIGGCALWLPHDVPALRAGTALDDVRIELDSETRFNAPARLRHVSDPGNPDRGVRLGCEWAPLSGQAERVLQLWIDQAQKRHRLLSLR